MYSFTVKISRSWIIKQDGTPGKAKAQKEECPSVVRSSNGNKTGVQSSVGALARSSMKIGRIEDVTLITSDSTHRKDGRYGRYGRL
uniref:Uncharacterized protein n=1 Tax=Glossina palpalis gambiensis TaxID=67801 RepID=A0A1B0BCS8_9MUSC